ncbi:gliding motility-associated C-terminal domain-containing protein [Reichenbachiella sp.]|uniref:T9SS type B sorting domain-containing protein n=1 Tax=Reichenbachiella sp. TaxID=2184521 RepID=UPI003B5C1F97
MNSYRKIFILILCIIPNILLAQEICDDGIDNDNNGFVDCYDSACSGDASCSDFYFGNSVVCDDPATQNPVFQIKLQWASADRTAFNSVTPAIGDIDGDGIPEVVSTNRQDNTVTILDGATGNTEHGPLNVGFDIAKTVAIANLDDDDCAEVFVRGFKNNNLRMYDCELNEVWSVNTNTGAKVSLISLADFNGDGVVELLHGNEIRNAHDGSVIIAGTGDFQDDELHGTVAIDILDDADCANCEGLEIVAAGVIYSVDIDTQTRTAERNINDILPAGSQFAIKNGWGWNFNTASVADYNQDGTMDVLYSAGQYVNGSIKTAVFFWDVENFNVISYVVPQNHSAGTGRINIADIDGDGQLNCTFVSKQRLYALDENLLPLSTWFEGSGVGYKDINEGSSGFTGCTVFDFNDDKAAEVIYRGEKYVHIIDGTTGTSLKQIKCTSRTFEEYPVVADVDGDGASEICVSCSTDDNTPFTPYSNGRYAQIRVFEADGGENWQPSRPIWNQHGYNNVNINDDLTIPTNMQDPGKIFSTNVCTTGPNRPLNAFLNQAPYLNETGCPSYVSPDIQLVQVSGVGAAQCPEGSFDITVTIENTGDIELTGSVPVTFYNGSPDEATSTKLNTVSATLQDLAVNETMDINTFVEGSGGDFDLYVSVNDDGSQNPPVTNFIRPVPECDDTNNLTFTGVVADPFDLQHEIVSHNIKCDPTKPDNGDARVFYFGTISETVDQLWKEDFEDLAVGTGVDNGSTAWEFTNSPTDADNLDVSFTGSTNELFFADVDGEAEWVSEYVTFSSYESANVSVDIRSSAKCDKGNDYLKLYYQVDGGSLNQMNSTKFKGNFGTYTATASGITGNQIRFLARVKNNSNDEFYYIDNAIVEGVKDAQTGEITAGFDFHWFQNNNFNDTIFTGNRYTALPEGNYQVVGSSQSNSCTSNVEDITINRVEELPVVGITKTQNLTDCGTPNGILDAYAIEGGSQVTAGYDFAWYIGNDFTTVVAVGPTAINLEARTYSVVVTNEASGCESTLSETVDTNQTTPNIFENNVAHVTDCIDFESGSITVNSDGPDSDYTFNWYNGSEVKATPDFTESGTSGATYDNLEAGFYTVEVQDNTTKCFSGSLTIQVEDNSASPDIVMTLGDNSSCTDNGNGSASAEINGGILTDFTFTYYTGSNTIPANQILTTSGTQGEVAQLLSAGNYLVTAEETSTGCVGRAYFTIVDNITNPTTPPFNEISVLDVTACNGMGQADGTVDASGVNMAAVDTDEFEAVVNGSFEVPNISNPPYNKGGSWTLLDQADALGWSTTNGSGNLEYWDNGFQGVPAYEGEQFAEINSDGSGAFYFDVVTKPGVRMVWSFAHRGRSGVDVMDLKIDDPAAGSPTTILTASTGNSAWQEYSGEYTIPDGQTITRFSFEAVSTASGNNTVGNFIDGVVFEVAPYYFQLFAGSNSSGDPDFENTTGVFENLVEGTYTLSIVNNITGCPTDDIPIIINLNEQEPILVRQLKTADEYCVDGNGTQRITATTESGDPTNGYRYEIYAGTDTTVAPYSGPFVDPDGDYTFTDLEDDTYRVVVISRDNECRSFTDVTILDDSDVPAFSTFIVNNNTSCSGGANGQIIANVFGESKEDFYWSWTDNADNPIKTDIDGAVDGTANLLDNLSAGTFKVRATHKVTGCTTGFQNSDVIDDPSGNFPTIILTEEAENTICNGVGNGSIKALVNEGAGAIDPIGYTVEWFLGADDTGTQLVDAIDPGNNSLPAFSGGANHIVDGLNAPVSNNEYTVRITNADGCANTATITLGNNPTTPVIDDSDVGDVVITEVESCPGGINYPEGQIELTDVTDGGFTNASDDFSYVWYFGSSNDPANIISNGDNIGTLKGEAATAVNISFTGDPATNHIVGLNTGFYTVEATNTTTGCVSDPVTIELTESLATITMGEANNNNQTNCDDNFNGNIDITAASGGDTFNFTFFVGANTDAANQIDINPRAAEADYDQVVVSNDAGTTTANIDNLPKGTYTAQATSLVTGCSNTYEFIIGEVITTPVITDASTGPAGTDVLLTEVTSCSGGPTDPNGVIQLLDVVAGADNDPVADFNYVWYFGASNDPANVIDDADDIYTQKGETPVSTIDVTGSTTSTISNLSAGFYTVEAINNTTGCTSAPVTIELTENLATITMGELNNTDQSNCNDNFNGNIDITAASGGDTFDFTFFVGANTDVSNQIDIAPRNAEADYDQVAVTNDAGTTTANIDNLPKGTYTAMAVSNVTGCSETYQFVIGETFTTTVITDADTGPAGTDVLLTEVTSCSGGPTDPNGAIQLLDVVAGAENNPATQFTYTWYFGSSNDPANTLDDNDDIYTQKGETPVSTIDIIGSASNHIQNLSAGFYTVEATNTTTGCVSDPVTIELTESLATITMGEANNNNQTNCDDNFNGNIDITAASGGDTFNFTFFVGANTDAANQIDINPRAAEADYDQVVVSNDAGTTTANIDNLPKGTYTAQATSLVTGCSNTYEFIIGEVITTPVITDASTGPAGTDVLLTEVTSCSGGPTDPNGVIQLLDVVAGADNDPVADFNYVWYFGASNDPANVIDDADDIYTQKGETPVSTIDVTGSTTSTISNLSAGFYTVEAINNTTGCTSAPVTIELTENLATITMGELNNNDQSNCNDNFNGNIDITAASGGDTFDFTFFVGANTDVSNQIDIAPRNAEADYDQVAVTNDAGTTTANIDNLPKGTYTAMAVSNVTGCSETYQFVIGETFTTTVITDADTGPAGTDVLLTEVTSCSGGPTDPNGAIQLLDVVAGAENNPATQFTYTWYFGSSNDPANTLDDNDDIYTQKGETPVSTIDIIGSASNHIQNLSAGFYTVEATNTTTGCVSDPVTIELTESLATITMGEANNNNQTNCDDNFNGNIDITAASGGDTFNFTFFVGANTDAANQIDINPRAAEADYDQVVVSNDAGTTTANIDNLPKGTYTAQATSLVTGCSNTYEFIIGEVITTPVITDASTGPAGTDVLLTEVTSCSGGPTDPNGVIQLLDVVAGADNDPVADFNYVWYFGASNDPANVIDDADDIYTQKGETPVSTIDVTGSTTSTISNLSAGFYTVEAINNTTGCTSAPVTIELTENLATITMGELNNTDQSNCNDNFNGNIDITAASGGDTFDFTFFVGANTDVSNQIDIAPRNAEADYDQVAVTNDAGTTTANIDNLPKGTYTAMAVSNVTGCSETYQFVIGETFTTTVITDADTGPAGTDVLLTEVTSCSGGPTDPNGAIQLLDVVAGAENNPATQFTYTWYFGSSNDPANTLDDNDDIYTQKGETPVSTIDIIGSASNHIQNLSAGFYTVEATNTTTGCVSDPVTIELTESLATITMGEANNNNQTNCDDNFNGNIDITAASGGDTFNFTFFVGANTDAANQIDINPRAAEADYDQVVVSNDAGTTTANIDNLPKGTYTAQATSLVTGCSNTYEFIIGEVITTPVITDASTGPAGTDVLLTEVTSCSGGPTDPNGVIQLLDVVAGADNDPVADFNYVWYFGASNDPANVIDDADDIYTQKGETPVSTIDVTGSTTSTISNLSAGFYTVEAINNTTGCTSAPVTIELTENLATITMGELNNNDQSNCNDNFNGNIDITAASGGDTFDFTFFVGANTDVSNQIDIAPRNAEADYDQVAVTNDAGTTTANIDNLPKGTYTAMAVSNVTGCSETYQFVIGETFTTTVITDADTGPAGTDVLLTEVTSCSGGPTDPNGAIQLLDVVAGAENNPATQFTYTWYFGSSNDPANTLDDNDDIYTQKGETPVSTIDIIGSASNHIQNLSAGFYTVEATNTTTGCVSDPVTIELTESLATITMGEANNNNQTNCDDNFNGNIDITAASGGDTFNFTFFVGANTDAANQIDINPRAAEADYDQVVVSNDAGTTTANIDNLPKGTYTAQATSLVTGCSNTYEFIIGEVITTPVITDASTGPAGTDVLLTEVTSCSGGPTDPNGVIQLLDVVAGADNDPVADFNYVWYFGASNDPVNVIDDADDIYTQKGETPVSTIDVTGSTTSTISNLSAGFYTVEAINNTTGCTSAPVTIELTENLIAIVPTVSVTQDDFSCNLATPTGQVTANITTYDGSPVTDNTGFTIEWFTGTNTLLANLLPGAIAGASATQDASPNTNDHIISNLPDGTYTVKVTHDNLGCFTTEQVVIRRATPIMSLTYDVNQDQTDCTPDGEVEVTAIGLTYSDGGGAPINFTPSYTYEFYEGQDEFGTVIQANSANPVLTGQASGYYTVIATETSSGCKSDPFTQYIDDLTPAAPAVTIAYGILPTDCASSTGTIDASLGADANITFEWWEGSDDYTDEAQNAADGISPINPAGYNTNGGTGTTTLTGLESGLYSLIIDYTGSTQCRYQVVYDLPFVGQQATTTIAVEHVEECPDDGSAEVGISESIFITYTATNGFSFDDGETVVAVPSGATGTISNNTDGVSMRISTTSSPASFADTDAITGQLTGATADIDILTSGYTDGNFDDISEYDIYLYAGDGVPADPLATYMVDGITYPLINLSSGRAPADNQPGDVVQFTGLPAGDYTAVARQISGPAFAPGNNDRCFSASAVETIDQRAYTPFIDGFTITDNTVCDGDPGDGEITVVAKKDAEDNYVPFDEPADFEFRWFVVGAETYPGDELLVEQDETTSTISNLGPGDYIVKIHRIVGGSGTVPDPYVYTGCTVEGTYTINTDPQEHTIDALTSLTHIEDCGATGSAVVEDADVTSGDRDDYDFTWYEDDAVTPIATAANDYELLGLAAGTYFVEAEHVLFGCNTPMVEFEIEDQTVVPTLSLTLNVIDTSCDPDANEGNGAIDWSITNDDGGNYSYQWYAGTSVAGGTILSNGVSINGAVGAAAMVSSGTLSGVDGGFYTLRVIDEQNTSDNCFVDATFELDEDIPTITIAAAGSSNTPNDNCSGGGYNGQFQITNVAVNGTPTGGTAGFDFSFTKSGGAHGGTQVGTNPLIIDLEPGDYEVIITDATGCSSTTTDFTIDDISVDPIAELNTKNPDTNCVSPGTNTGNGDLTVQIVGGAAVSNYSFRWFRGTDVTDTDSEITAVAFTNADQGSAVITGGDDETISDLSPGQYTVLVTDNDADDDNDGCFSTTTFTITNVPEVHEITGITLAHVEDCGGTGSATIQDADVTSGDRDDYDFTWYEDDAVTPIATAANDYELLGLAAGTYFVEAEYTASTPNNGCMTSLFELEIEDQTVVPTLSLTLNVIDTSCDPDANEGNGAIDWSITNDDGGNYSYQWYAGTSVAGGTILSNGASINGAVGAAAMVASGTLSGVDGGFYTLRVIDEQNTSDNCFVDATFELTEEQPTISIATDGADFTNTPNDNCAGGGYNGSFEIFDIAINGVPQGNTTGFNFTFTKAGGAAHGGTQVGSNPLVSDLEPGDYQVEIIDATGCSSGLTDFTIDDISVNPIAELNTKNPDTNCVSPGTNTGNGDLTVQIVGGAAVSNYSFRWFRGTDVTDTDSEITAVAFTNADQGSAVITGGDDETISDLSPGQYTVLVTDNDADDDNDGCFSTTTFTITNVPEVHEITGITLAHVEDCGGTGSATIQDADVTSGDRDDYDFTWYEDDAVTPIATAANDYELLGLAAGTYFVEAEYTASTPNNGCMTSLFELEIEDQTVVPTLSLTLNVIDTSCDPDANEGNGAIDWSITNDDGGNYSYQWYAGTSVAGGTILSNGASINGAVGAAAMVASGTLSGVDGGFYTLRVIDEQNTSDNCFVDATFELTEEQPTISIATDGADFTNTPNDNCAGGGYNGSFEIFDIAINGVPQGNTTGFNFTFTKAGGAAHGGTQVGSNPLVSDLEPGDYQVEIIDATGCSSGLTDFTIDDISVNPIAELNTKNPDTNCVSPGTNTGNGDLTVQIVGGAAVSNYSFRWFRGTDVTDTDSEITAVAFTNADQGSAVITGGDDETISDLSPGQYTVLVTDNDADDDNDGCFSTTTFTITNVPEVHEITGITLAHVEDCGGTGSATIQDADVTSGDRDDYDFTWYEDDAVTPIATAANDYELLGLAAGTYFVEAEYTASTPNNGCMTSLFELEIEDQTVVPTLSLTLNVIDTSCDPDANEGNGAIDWSITNDDGGNYSYQWYAGTSVAGGTILSNGASINGAVGAAAMVASGTLSGVDGGFYTLRVIDEQNTSDNCFVDATFELTEEQPTISIATDGADFTNTPNDNCAGGGYNGSFEIFDIAINGVPQGNTTGFNFTFTKAGGAAHGGTQVGSNPLVSDLEPGDYQVEIIDATGCSSGLTDFTIDDISVNPIAELNTKNPDTNCVSPGTNTGNGDLTVQIVGGAAVSNYSFRWFRGTDVTDTDSEITAVAFTNADQGSAVITGGDDETISDLSPGQYTVLVTDNDADDDNDGCFSTTTFTITNVPEVHEITGITLAHVEDCGGTGSATIQDADVTSGDRDDYDFTWYEDDAVTPIATAANDYELLGLAAGTYFVEAEYTASTPNNGCMTSLFELEIEDQTVVPTLSLTLNVIDTSCDPDANEGNGAIDWSITNDDGGNYSYQWYAGTSVAGGTILSNGASINGAVGAAAMVASGTLSGVDGGFYTLRVIDEQNTSDNCFVDATFELTEEQPTISIATDGADFTNTPNDNCAGGGYNGSFEIFDIAINGVPQGNTTGFNFTFTKAGGAAHGGTQVGSNPLVSDLEPGDYQVEIIDATGCSSGLTDFTIDDISVNPIAELNTKNPDTNCVSPGTNTGNGDLTVQIVGGAAVSNYSFRWFRGTDVTDTDSEITAVAFTNADQGSAVITGGDDETISDLSPGQYTVLVTDNDADDDNDGCFSTTTFTITNVPATHILNEANIDAAIVHVTDCGGSNGTITIADADVTSGDVDDYEFTWYSEGPLTDIGVPVNTTMINTLTPGTYYVKATHIATGCNTGQIAFEIEDQSEAPGLSLSENITDSSCDPDANEGNGAIDWVIENTAGGTAPAGSYNFQWYVGATAIPGTNEVTGAGIGGISGTIGAGYSGTITGLDGGTYTLRVTDGTSPNNTCYVDQTITLSETIPTYAVTAFNNDPNTNCVGGGYNGEFEITTISGGALADFTYTFAKNDDPGYVFNNVTDWHVDQLAPGSYEVYFVNTATQCEGNVVDFVIDDDTTQPTISFTLDQADEYCTGGNGQITVVPDATTLGNAPTYLWAPGGETTQSISNLDQATTSIYTVTVTDPTTGCSVTDSYELPFDPVDILVDVNADVNISPTTMCGANVNGSIDITNISPDAIGNYTYTWYQNTYDATGAAAMAAQTTANATGLAADTYYVEATSGISGCTSKVFEFIVEDQSVNPVVALVDFELQNNCDLTPGNGNGFLSVTADGSTNLGDYSFDWTSASGVPGPGTNPLYSDLDAGTYTVEVENLTTLCTTSETYGMINDTNNPLVLSITTIPNENCVDPNGALAINVLNSLNPTAVFEYYLIDGTDSSPTPFDPTDQMASNFADDVVDGDYTVMVEDTDGGCLSEPTFITIESDKDDMQMTIVEDHPLTKCDFQNVRADGQATVTPGPESASRYTIYWHDGASLADAVMDSTLTLHELLGQTYTVEMTDRLTGCSISESITINSDIELVPTPLVDLISDVTNCITPNGSVSAAIDSAGTVSGYTFEWTDNGGTVISSTFGAAGLDLGTYSVRATDLESECVSDAASIEVVDARVNPEFNVETTESTCSELEFGTDNYAGNGEASLTFASFVTSGIENQYWAEASGVDDTSPIDPTDEASIISTNELMSGMNPGDYKVLVIDDQDCSYQANFTIETDIEIFNGVSDNGDGKNDYFRISCADRFPQNSVKIYTRSGTLVFKTSGYEDDVSGNVFTGKRNTGVGGGSDGLPAGTYFYIFDKGEGNVGDVYQGYLELVK